MLSLNMLAWTSLGYFSMIMSKYDALDELQVVFSQLFQTFWPIILIILFGVIVIGLVPGASRWLGSIFKG